MVTVVAIDAGQADAGIPDSGIADAGPSDAGNGRVVRGGPSDLTVGCSCAGVSGRAVTGVLVFLILALRLRRRPRA
jgi:uncharacterized protein (TIGR03382 family)